MSSFTEFFCGKPPTGCSEGPPSTMPASQNGHQVCHRHAEIPQSRILLWSALSLLAGFFLGLFLFWANYAVELEGKNKWSHLATQVDNFMSNTGYFPWFLLALLLMLWAVSTVVICSRKFASITDYVIVAVAVPVTGLSSASPIILSIIE